ncbi:MAG: DUF3078 domain-containing protein [Vicingus serpentipes]|nr:DUF3078 domain-containing protein [Vicingus serpentipes]
MKKIFVLLASILIIGNTSAQPIEADKVLEAEEIIKNENKDTLDGWSTGGVFGINFTQVSLTNWSAGGENSISLNTFLSVFANYQKGNTSFDNSLDVGYGFLKSGNANTRKTDDKVDFTSKFGHKASKGWYYAGLANFKTQMMPGYNYPDDSTKISDFMAPAYILGAIGMDYKPNKYFTMFISPFTTKITIVNNQNLANAGAYGVDAAVLDTLNNIITKGKSIRSEYGGYLRTIFKKSVMKNVNLQTKLELFSNYGKNPSNIDVNWETLITMKVNKYIKASISTLLFYDDDIKIAIDKNNDGIIDKVGPRVQFKEILGIGISFDL